MSVDNCLELGGAVGAGARKMEFLPYALGLRLSCITGFQGAGCPEEVIFLRLVALTIERDNVSPWPSAQRRGLFGPVFRQGPVNFISVFIKSILVFFHSGR